MAITSARESLSEDGLKKGAFVVIPDEGVKGQLRLVVRTKSRVKSEADIVDYSIGVTLGDDDREEFFIANPSRSHTTVPSLVQSLQSTYGDVSVALKELASHQRDSTFREVIKRYSKLNNNNIVKVFGCIENSPTVVLEFCPYTLLERLAEHEQDPYENLEHYLGYASQLTNGMQFLEANNIVHGELCARNVLLKEDGTVVLINFGLLGSRKSNVDPEYIPWVPIEVLKGKPHDECGDVWAYAVVLYEIFAGGTQPYKGVTRDIVNYLESEKRLPKPKRCTDEYYEIMRDCWHYNPKQRPFFRDIISRLTNHNYLTMVPAKGHQYQNVSSH